MGDLANRARPVATGLAAFLFWSLVAFAQETPDYSAPLFPPGGADQYQAAPPLFLNPYGAPSPSDTADVPLFPAAPAVPAQGAMEAEVPLFLPPGDELGLEQLPDLFFNPYGGEPSPAGLPAIADPLFSPAGGLPLAESLPEVRGGPPSALSSCGSAHEPETENTQCPVQPSYYYNGQTRRCAARTRTSLAGRYGSSYEDLIHSHVALATQATGVSPALVMALLDAESGFNPMASNEGGDTGMAQFQIGTARSTLNYWRQSGSSTIPLQSYTLETRPPSPACQGNSYFRITQACIQSLQQEQVCGSERVGLRPNLYCPQFAVHMMAWHLKRESVATRVHTVAGASVNVVSALQGDGDPVAAARYLASTYNRGCLVQNSFVYLLEGQSQAVSARDYGALWSAPVSTSYRSSSARPCPSSRVLSTERINRCYIWRVAGLCGGFGDSLVGQYLRHHFCSSSGGSAPQDSHPFGGVQ